MPLLFHHTSSSWYQNALLLGFLLLVFVTLYFQLAFGYFFKPVNLAIKMIQEISGEIVLISSFIGLPLLQSLLDVPFLAWIIIIASYLTTLCKQGGRCLLLRDLFQYKY